MIPIAPFSWIFVLMGRRSLRDPVHEALRTKLTNSMFPYKFTNRMFKKINSIFYTLTKYKKFATRIEGMYAENKEGPLR